MANQIHKASSEVDALVPELWSAKLYDVLLAKLPFNDSIDREYEGDIQNLGDTVKIQTIPEFSVGSELAEGSANDADSVTATSQSLVINKRIVKDFIVTNKAQLQSLPFMDKLRDHAVYAIMKKMHQLIVEAAVPSASAPDHQIGFDSGTTMALSDILEAKELLDDQDLMDEGRKSIMGVSQYNDLFNISGFTSRDFIPAGSPLTAGAINTPVMGFDVAWTTELGNEGYFFHPSFLTLAIQEQLNVNVYDLGSDGIRASRVNTDLLFGLKLMDNKRIVKIS